MTYLPFKDVKALCISNKSSLDYCTNPKYNNNWKKVIDDTYKNVPLYKDKLKSLWNALGLPSDTYNYQIYTKMLDMLDSITKKMIYWKQGDLDAFNDKDKYKNQNLPDWMMVTENEDDINDRFLAFFLLGKIDKMKEYIDQGKVGIEFKDYLDIAKGGKGDEYSLNNLYLLFADAGNLRGVKYMLDKGAEPDANDGKVIYDSINEYNLPLLKLLLKYDVDEYYLNHALMAAFYNSNREAAKMLRRYGAEETNDPRPPSWL